MQFYLICIFQLGIFIQTFSNNQSHLADSLFLSEKYFEAAIEYERLSYFSTDFRDKSRYRFKKAMSFKNMGDFEAAKQELIKTNIIGLDPDEKRQINYETALITFLGNDYEYCAKTLIKIDFDSYDTIPRMNLYMVASLNNAMLQNYQLSETYAIKFADLAYKDQQLQSINAQLNNAFNKKNLPNLKSQKVFDWISIIPGFGQFYVGEIGEGVTNIALNLTAFSFGVYQILNGFYFTGYFVGTLSINKFYFGGRTRAENTFNEVNTVRLTQFNMVLKELLISKMKLDSSIISISKD